MNNKKIKMYTLYGNAWYAPNYGSTTVDISSQGFKSILCVVATPSGFTRANAQSIKPIIAIGAITPSSIDMNFYGTSEIKAGYSLLVIGTYE